jgi:hypothetical protein
VFAHGLKLYTIGETLEVTSVLQGHLAALVYRDLWWRGLIGHQSELVPGPRFGAKEPWIAQSPTSDQDPVHPGLLNPLHDL